MGRVTALCIGFLFAAVQIQAQSNTFKSAGSREDISTLAGKMLDYTNRARTAIQEKDQKLALQDVNKAESYLQQVQARADGSTMIPVYQEFVSVAILAPVRAEQSARHSVVHQVAGDYTSVVVNTTVAKNNLAAAEKALQNYDLKTADAALSDVQEGVQIEASEADMPLVKARENLILARSNAREKKYGEAQAALQAASKALGRYAQENGPHASAAKDLKQQIDNTDKNLQQNHAGILPEMNRWWNTTADWTPYKNAHQG
jgi:hypothetical protein